MFTIYITLLFTTEIPLSYDIGFHSQIGFIDPQFSTNINRFVNPLEEQLEQIFIGVEIKNNLN